MAGVQGLMNNLKALTIGIGSLAMMIVFIIIMLTKVKTNSTVLALNSAAINSTVDNSVTAVQEPNNWYSLIAIFVVLGGVGYFVFKALSSQTKM